MSTEKQPNGFFYLLLLIYRGLQWLSKRQPSSGLSYSQCTRSARKRLQ